jgi:hypothetical protein
MKLHRLTGMIAAAVALGALAVVAHVVPLAAQQGRNGQIQIVKDCKEESGTPGSDICLILASNLPQLPAGTEIYYDLSAGPTAGPGYFDNNIFVFVNPGQWAVGRCTGPNDFDKTPERVGVCTISDGVGPLAGFTARLKVTYHPGGNGALFDWNGAYHFDHVRER